MVDGDWLSLPHLTSRVVALVAALDQLDRSILADDRARRDALERVAAVAADLARDLAPLADG